jgi:hypothetical protein
MVTNDVGLTQRVFPNAYPQGAAQALRREEATITLELDREEFESAIIGIILTTNEPPNYLKQNSRYELAY